MTEPGPGPRGDRQDPPPPAAEVDATDLPSDDGLGHRIRFWIPTDDDRPHYRLVSWPAEGDQILAIEENHERPDGAWCGGYVSFDPDLCDRMDIYHTGHQLISLQPLHVEASLLCRCGSHGFIREGRWHAC